MRWFVSFFSDVLQVLTFTDPRLTSPHPQGRGVRGPASATANGPTR